VLLQDESDGKTSPLRLEEAGTRTRKKKSSYQFGGPIGAFVLTFALPALMLGLNFLCDKVCSLSPQLMLVM
jgi:hypothetical protein